MPKVVREGFVFRLRLLRQFRGLAAACMHLSLVAQVLNGAQPFELLAFRAVSPVQQLLEQGDASYLLGIGDFFLIKPPANGVADSSSKHERGEPITVLPKYLFSSRRHVGVP
jgi:hypothetical protein